MLLMLYVTLAAAAVADDANDTAATRHPYDGKRMDATIRAVAKDTIRARIIVPGIRTLPLHIHSKEALINAFK